MLLCINDSKEIGMFDFLPVIFFFQIAGLLEYCGEIKCCHNVNFPNSPVKSVFLELGYFCHPGMYSFYLVMVWLNFAWLLDKEILYCNTGI